MPRSADHRARPCTIRDPAWVMVRLPDGETARRFAARLNARMRFRADILVVIAGLVIGIIASTVVGWAFSNHATWLVRFGVGVLMVVAGGLAGLVLARPLNRRETRHVVDVYLAERLCPSCAYSIGAIPVDPDGCTTCPECGTAWRIPAR
jgi:hypothetical protein